MRPMPRLWQSLMQDWLSLEPELSRSWWFALAHSRWSVATAWREEFLAFACQDGLVTRDVVTDYFAKVATLPHLVQLVEGLMQERVLLRRDGQQIEETLLALADCQGNWKHLHL